jgi:hypothetical protein
LILFAIDIGVTLESEGGCFEIENEADLELGNREIAKELGDVHGMNGIGNFEFYNDSIIGNQVRDEFANEM